MEDKDNLRERTDRLAIHLSNPDDRHIAHEAANALGIYERELRELQGDLQHVFNRVVLGDHHFVEPQPPLEDHLRAALEKLKRLIGPANGN